MPGHVSEKELQTESLTGLGATTSPSMPRERQRDIENIEKEKEFQQFLKDTGRNERNPYGNEGSGIFGALSRKFPGLVTYDNILSPQQIALQNRLAFDRYKNPFAERNILGQQTGADIGAGIPRMGVQPGMRVQTPDGRVVTAQAKPLSGITAAAAAAPYLGNVINFLAPKQATIPGFEADNPMDTGANLGEDRQSVVETAINKLRDTFSQPSSEVIPAQEVSPIQNVEPVGLTVSEAVLGGSPPVNTGVSEAILGGSSPVNTGVSEAILGGSLSQDAINEAYMKAFRPFDARDRRQMQARINENR